ncbi:MAG TPA: alpha/beta fold hydrolase [Burkholderiaceae bacterium]|nr:alpha/beta fold hydrolase [Burkholderiaceae bacterium]
MDVVPMSAQPATIITIDGFELAGQTYGAASSCRAGVLVVGAMGVDQRYYSAFAHWLALQGFFVVTFDYRGMGDSRPARYRRSLRGFIADVSTWATRDVPAALEFVGSRIGTKPLLWLGHSLGGQILGQVPNRDRVAAMVTVATGSGYWAQNAWRLRPLAWWLWHVAAPVAMRLAGYFPGRRLKKVGDLPAGVMRQWRAWCLDPDYCVGVLGPAMREQYARLTTPILSLSFTDDEFMSRTNTESMHGFYAGAPREMRRIAPREIGVRHIGHFGFFRRRYAEHLWPQAAAWLARFAH